MLKSCSKAADNVQGGGVVVPVGVIATVGVINVGVGGISCSSITFTMTATCEVATGVFPLIEFDLDHGWTFFGWDPRLNNQSKSTRIGFGVSRRISLPFMYSSIRDQFPSGFIEEVISYSLKGWIDCPEAGLRMVTLALLPGRLQASKLVVTSKNTMMSVITVPFLITTFRGLIRPATKTKKRAMEFPTQVSR